MTTVRQALQTAVQYHQAGQLQRAEQLYRQILRADPHQPDALHLLGVLAHQVGRHDLAIDAITQAVRLRPGAAEMHNNLANALKAVGRAEEALACYRQAIHLKPSYTDAHHNLGCALLDLRRPAEAQASFEEALRLRPDYPEAESNLGNVLLQQGRVDEAQARLCQVLRRQPQFAEAHHNLAGVLLAQGQYDEALASFREAIRLRPDMAEAHTALAGLLLLLEDFEQGWREYEWRRQLSRRSRPAFAQPPWDGSDLQGRTILLQAEQGLGDTLQFVRYAPLVKDRGGSVVLACQKPLLRLLTGVRGLDRLVPLDEPLPEFDVYAPLLSLPHLLRTTLQTIPADIPYLSAEPELLERWGGELGSRGAGVSPAAQLPRLHHEGPHAGLRIGIAWQGSPAHRRDQERSMPLREFAPLAQVPGVQLFSLQKGHGTEQLAEVANLFPVSDLGDRLDDFAGTAVLMRQLDLIVTCDTALAHLAGALGVPVWVALSFVPDWRWLLGRQDSPWYPSMRLFRQSRRGDWPGVFQRLAAAAGALLSHREPRE